MSDIRGGSELVRRIYGRTVQVWKEEELVGTDALNG